MSDVLVDGFQGGATVDSLLSGYYAKDCPFTLCKFCVIYSEKRFCELFPNPR